MTGSDIEVWLRLSFPKRALCHGPGCLGADLSGECLFFVFVFV